MAYERQEFFDEIKDASGNIVREGTLLKTEHLRHMEDGILAVVSTTEQDLTEAQKEQARKNIGAAKDGTQSALSEKQINALNTLLRMASYTENASSAYERFCEAFGLNPDDAGEVVIDGIKLGAASYENGKLQIAVNWDARATLVPVGQYLKNGVTYKFSLGAVANSYMYGVQILTVDSTKKEFPYTGSTTSYSGVVERIVDTGYIRDDYVYTPEVDKCVFCSNFKKSNDGAMNESDYETIRQNFTVEIL